MLLIVQKLGSRSPEICIQYNQKRKIMLLASSLIMSNHKQAEYRLGSKIWKLGLSWILVTQILTLPAPLDKESEPGCGLGGRRESSWKLWLGHWMCFCKITVVMETACKGDGSSCGSGRAVMLSSLHFPCQKPFPFIPSHAFLHLSYSINCTPGLPFHEPGQTPI
jgi:hypothetical protein